MTARTENTRQLGCDKLSAGCRTEKHAHWLALVTADSYSVCSEGRQRC